MGLSGIPWWTTDISGFYGGNPDDPEFRELFTRWFQGGAFCPMMSQHGDREPKPDGEHTPTGSNHEVKSSPMVRRSMRSARSTLPSVRNYGATLAA